MARRFPVCCQSDEFNYFPQLKLIDADWSKWDDFSSGSIAETAAKLKEWEAAIQASFPHASLEDRADIRLVAECFSTLREQLTLVGPHKSQPTFHLTVLSLGLAEAIEANDPEAFSRRLMGAPAFLERAIDCLGPVPRMFLELGLDMADDVIEWLVSLAKARPEVKEAGAALEDFRRGLAKLEVVPSFRLDEEVPDRVYKNHMRCHMGVGELEDYFDSEIARISEVLSSASQKNFPGHGWKEAIESLPGPSLPRDGMMGHFGKEVRRLGIKCLDLGLVSKEDHLANPVTVAPVPSFLSAIRSAAAYGMPPGHPASGGTFYVLASESLGEAKNLIQKDYRMLAAHETWPGHHLLDLHRWNNPREVRRHIEHPMFYEGWACFAETIMDMAGYYDAPGDSLLLNKRHLWRAVRGRIDVGLQCRKMEMDAAAGMLLSMGMTPARAMASARRYALKPAYQVCYTLGLRRFEDIFAKSGMDLAGFTKEVMTMGEPDFAELLGKFSEDET